MTAISDAVTSAYAAARSLAGVSVTYTRDGDSVALTVIPGRSLRSEQSDNIILESLLDDYLILASELVLSGSAVTPMRGDTITVGGVEYDLLSDQGEPAWSYLDQTKTVIRVHVKR